MAMRSVCVPPSGAGTVHSRSAQALTSAGESMKYARWGAVKRSGSAVGTSCVATRHPGGVWKRTSTGAPSIPRAHTKVAGMFRCAWLASMPV